MKKSFEVIVGSLPDYEDLIAELYIDGIFIGMITQEGERGIFNFEIERREHRVKVSLKDLIDGLKLASHKLSVIG